MLAALRKPPPRHRADAGAGRRIYALEGSVFVAGSLCKAAGQPCVISSAPKPMRWHAHSRRGGVTIVPALAGLGAPHWRPEARGIISGLSFASGKAQLARAALEAMAHQMHDLAAAFAADGAPWPALRIDGGMSANDWMAQDLANILDLSVERPAFVETTALGAAMCWRRWGRGCIPPWAKRQERCGVGRAALLRPWMKRFGPSASRAGAGRSRRARAGRTRGPTGPGARGPGHRLHRVEAGGRAVRRARKAARFHGSARER